MAAVLYIVVRNYTITTCYYHCFIINLMRHPIMAVVLYIVRTTITICLEQLAKPAFRYRYTPFVSAPFPILSS